MTPANDTGDADVIVIGGGAAGLLAAASAGSRRRKVVLLEKNSKLGVKILMSGGTRCNITHACDARGIAEAFGNQGRFLRSALAALSPEEVIALVESRGVVTKVESTGKVFPVSNRAIDVRDALAGYARESGVKILKSQPVQKIGTLSDSETAPRFEIQTDSDTFHCRSVILTTGGRSYPGCGTTGDGYAWAKQLGHTLISTVPALTPVVSHTDWIRDLSGITLESSSITTKVPASGKKKALRIESGPVLFTHFGLSGPTVMNLSREVARHYEENPGQHTELICDFVPQQSEASVQQTFADLRQTAGQRTVASVVNDWLPRRFSEALLEQCNLAQQTRCSEIPRTGLRSLIEALKRHRIVAHGTMGYQKAEVTAGGISLKEVDSRTMQSKVQPGLFLAGEILDVDGPIGGYNFQAAFSTGWLAGQHA